MSFEELPHTADIRMRVRAGTQDDLFSEACSALMQVMYGTDRRDGGMRREVELDAADRDTLLFDFLSELLYITDAEGIVVARAGVKVTGNHVHAVIEGEAFDPSRHCRGTEVKGISWSGLAIRKEANSYMLDILFDV